MAVGATSAGGTILARCAAGTAGAILAVVTVFAINAIMIRVINWARRVGLGLNWWC